MYKYNLTFHRSQRSLKAHPVKGTIAVTLYRQKVNHTVREGNTLILLFLAVSLGKQSYPRQPVKGRGSNAVQGVVIQQISPALIGP